MPLAGERCVCLIPFKTAAVYPFSFPFGRKVNLKNAVAMNFRPLIGDREDGLSIITQVVEQRSNLTKGAAWFASKSETSAYEELLGEKTAFLPAPLAFVSEVSGDGLIIWHEGDGSAALWVKGYVPQLYRYMSDTEGSPEELAQWMRAYAASAGGEIDPESIRIYDASETGANDIQKAGEAAFASSPGAASLDFSNIGATLAEQNERFFKTSFRMLKMLSAAGIFFLAISSALLAVNIYMKNAFDSAPSDIYRLAMGSESRSPLSSIAKGLRSVSGGGVQLTLDGMLSNFAAAWADLPKGSGVKLDAIRYGLERTEVEGQAPKTENIQQLREALSKNGFSVKLGDVQQIPGGGMRFNLHLTEGGSK